jgi:hypothetical protein
MSKSKLLAMLVTVSALVLISAVTPASARWHGRWHGGGWRSHYAYGYSHYRYSYRYARGRSGCFTDAAYC